MRRFPLRRRRSRVLAAASAATVAVSLLLTACSGSSGSAGGAQDTAVIALSGGEVPDQIVPLNNSAQFTVANMQDFQDLMYRPLIWYGGETGNEFGLNAPLSLAYAPAYSDNDTVVTVTLKPWKWSDGQPVTSRDVQFDFNLIKADKSSLGMYTPGDLPDNVKTFTILSPSKFQLT
jgi:peptide/nickel transport system substrate-binding protein